MGYREFPPPEVLRPLVECEWVVDGPEAPVRVLPDGCMDLIQMHGGLVVAGPDTTVSVAHRGAEPIAGLRFRPGVLPRLIGVPASTLLDRRVPLDDLRIVGPRRPLVETAVWLAACSPSTYTAPWSLGQLGHVTRRLGTGASVSAVADDIGWSKRTMQRQCAAVYGYGPTTLRRILRFRRAARLLAAGLPPGEVAARAGYADQPHLHREVREFAGVTPSAIRSAQPGSEWDGANRSTETPSGSSTVA